MAKRPPPCFVFHDLQQATWVLSAAAEAGVAVALLTPPDGAGHAGPEFYAEIIRLARERYPAVAVESVLDCGNDGALALSAMGQGWRAIVLRPHGLRGRLAGAARTGLRLLARPPKAVDLGAARDPKSAVRAIYRAAVPD